MELKILRTVGDFKVFKDFKDFKVFSGRAKSNKFVLLLDKTGCASEKLK